MTSTVLLLIFGVLWLFLMHRSLSRPILSPTLTSRH